jgi:mannosyltransferase OCH1-like enzyme
VAIPKLIHRQWFGPRIMPDRYKENAAKWIELNPEWVLQDYDETDLPRLENQEAFDECGWSWIPGRGDSKEASLIQVTKADIAGYELIYQFGGLYVNCDMRPIKPLPESFDEHDLILSYEVDGTLISNAFMACAPGNPVIGAVIDAIPESIKTVRAGVDYVTGPRLLTRIVNELAPDALILPARFCNPWLPMQPQRIYYETICEHEWGHATSDETLWPDHGRQPGLQRYH